MKVSFWQMLSTFYRTSIALTLYLLIVEYFFTVDAINGTWVMEWRIQNTTMIHVICMGGQE